MRNILFRIWSLFTGCAVPKPGLPPRGCIWKWDLFEQKWIPTIDPERDRLGRP